MSGDKDWIVKLALVALLAALLFGWTKVQFKDVAKTSENIAGNVAKALKGKK